jgi:hypothetical protein
VFCLFVLRLDVFYLAMVGNSFLKTDALVVKRFRCSEQWHSPLMSVLIDAPYFLFLFPLYILNEVGLSPNTLSVSAFILPSSSLKLLCCTVNTHILVG